MTIGASSSTTGEARGEGKVPFVGVEIKASLIFTEELGEGTLSRGNDDA